MDRTAPRPVHTADGRIRAAALDRVVGHPVATALRMRRPVSTGTSRAADERAAGAPKIGAPAAVHPPKPRFIVEPSLIYRTVSIYRTAAHRPDAGSSLGTRFIHQNTADALERGASAERRGSGQRPQTLLLRLASGIRFSGSISTRVAAAGATVS